MFLGGDQYKNDLSNNLIIKCHECGDTNLRYLGGERTGDYEKPYICGNNHYTWGGIDDWSIKGQTDTLFNNIEDCCCEGIECEFPKSIKVNFSGLIGVQAREGSYNGFDNTYTDNLSADLLNRVYMPYSMCYSCFEFDFPSEFNGPWSFSCGETRAEGTCSRSDDQSILRISNFDSPEYCDGCGSFSNGEECNYTFRTISVDYRIPGVLVPNPADFFDPCGNHAISIGPIGNVFLCCGNVIGDTVKAGPFFTENAFDNFGGPSFIIKEYQARLDNTLCPEPVYTNVPIPTRPGENPIYIGPDPDNDPTTSHIPIGSVFFATYSSMKVKRVINNGISCCCISVRKQHWMIKRIHPTADNNSLSQWVLTQEGINPAYQDMTWFKSTGNCSCEYEDPGMPTLININTAMFCDPSNSTIPCTDCIDPIDAYIDGDQSHPRTIWPWRVPAFESAGIGPTEYQLIRDSNNNFGADGYITAYECGCLDFPPPNGNAKSRICGQNEPCVDIPFNLDCFEELKYPSCLEKGNLKCSDVDSKYRIECDNPSDKFTVSIKDPGQFLENHRYTLEFINETNGKCGLHQINVLFHPEWARRDTLPGAYDALGTYYPPKEVDLFVFPKHPNPECATPSGGLVRNYGFPQRPLAPGQNPETTIGIRKARLDKLIASPTDFIDQPHCLRRVKSPSFSNFFPYYAVNTADISNQTLILDRYYPTGNNYDYIWKDSLAQDNKNNQAFVNNQGDIGLTDYTTNKMFPYPFTANSGSLEEPEIIAIIHSESGVGGQIAFQTFPVSYDTDELLDIEYDNLKPGRPLCLYKNRVTVHGYGVMYPLIDDPLWKEEEFTYPIILAGQNYEIGDKIEFRCWKTLEDADDRDVVPNEEESIWREECVETIIATATITELNDERLPPTGVVQIVSDAIITAIVVPLNQTRYNETYQLESVVIDHSGIGYDIDDTIYIQFDDDSFDGIHYEITPYVTVTSTGLNGKIETIELTEPGEFYKTIRTGGIRWFEFDETDDFGNLLISVGNCPCEYDICVDPDYNSPLFDPASECIGCISKEVYPSGHKKLDALLAGFPSFPNIGCTFPSADNKVAQLCNVPGFVNCNENCSYTQNCYYFCYTAPFGGEIVCEIQEFPILLADDDCKKNNCSCLPVPFGGPMDPGTKIPSSCYCLNYKAFPYIGPFSLSNNQQQCFPINNTWEFYENNYARSACSGEPVSPEQRPYIDGYTVIPPKKAQYKYEWIPKASDFVLKIPDYLPEGLTQIQINSYIDDFLLNSSEGCNPLRIDRFDKSYKFPNFDFVSSNIPCRKWNDLDPLPPDHTRTIDNYCRVYGFYQQRQPSCEVIYRGQYILRAAQKNNYISQESLISPRLPGTDCEPLIEDITIRLRKKEAKFDISVGAPYNQDYLIPENLPEPYIGPDNKYEVTADPWNDPSLNRNNNERLFDHGFFEPNRKAYTNFKEIPGESVDETDLIPTIQINPIFGMYDIDGGDLKTIDNEIRDIYIDEQWDLPDPRSNIRIGTEDLDQGDFCDNPIYTGIELSGFPASGLRNTFINDCPYPWENINCQNNDCNNYCMFSNNSAEIVLEQIEECEYCSSEEIVKYSKNNFVITKNINAQIANVFHYTYKVLISSAVNGNRTKENYLLFRAYGNANNKFSENDFQNLIQQYLNIWIDRTDIDNNLSLGDKLLKAFSDDKERTIFWNFIFQGANNNELENLTKVEVYAYVVDFNNFQNLQDYINNPGSWYAICGAIPCIIPETIQLLFEETRCKYPKKGGSVKSLLIQNEGKGYAFEIEERVPPTGIISFVEDPGKIEITMEPAVIDRRRETYYLSEINVSGVLSQDFAMQDEQNNWVLKPEFASSGIPLVFNDSNYRRGQIFYIDHPTVTVAIDPANREVIYSEVFNQGEVYKYVGTNEHRAFPVSIVLNNYWNHPNEEGRKIGKNAILRPVIGVDPTDQTTYGKIKRIEIEYGGIEYVMPEIYWIIDTKTGKYDTVTGDLVSGLDIQHLVDSCKYQIDGNGISSSGINQYLLWTGGPVTAPMGTYDNFEEIIFPDKISPDSNPFLYSKKYYYHTGADKNGEVIKWSNRVNDWHTVIQSGSCPFGNGGLLDRKYDMALVEEVDMIRIEGENIRPIHGNCDYDFCDEIRDLNCYALDLRPQCCDLPDNGDPGDGLPGDGLGDSISDGGESSTISGPCDSPYCDLDPDNCHLLLCNVFSVYDAHRYPKTLVGDEQIPLIGFGGLGIGSSWFATPRPFMQGCEKTIPIADQGDVSNYGLSTWCEKDITTGYADVKTASNPIDKCYDSEYSMYAEFSKIITPAGEKNLLRAYNITYKMKDPITMTISSNDNEYDTYLLENEVCAEGNTPLDSGNRAICECEE